MKTTDVISLGNALMDFLVDVDPDFLQQAKLIKGEFHIVSEQQAQQLLEKIKHLPLEIVPGGSAANTIRGVAFLGGTATALGKVGLDQYGERYIKEMISAGVTSRIVRDTNITGQALTFITPDAQRTFSVHLGAALELKPHDIKEDDIAASNILHLEGYQLEGPTQAAAFHAIQLAKKNQTLLALDVADPGVIRRNKEVIRKVASQADILFLNEQEALEFTGMEEEKAVQEIIRQNPHVQAVIVKLSSRGSLIYHQGKITKIKSFLAKAVDTTGAGDSYAAGFLYGWTQGWDIEKAGRLGALLAARIVELKGVALHRLNKEKVFLELQGKV